MLENKSGFLLIESILLLEIVIVISFVLANTIIVYANENNEVLYNSIKEDALMRQAYE